MMRHGQGNTEGPEGSGNCRCDKGPPNFNILVKLDFEGMLPAVRYYSKFIPSRKSR